MNMFSYIKKIVNSIEKDFYAELVELKTDEETGQVTMTLNLHPECNPELKKDQPTQAFPFRENYSFFNEKEVTNYEINRFMYNDISFRYDIAFYSIGITDIAWAMYND